MFWLQEDSDLLNGWYIYCASLIFFFEKIPHSLGIAEMWLSYT